jgi:hypothetical protein
VGLGLIEKTLPGLLDGSKDMKVSAMVIYTIGHEETRVWVVPVSKALQALLVVLIPVVSLEYKVGIVQVAVALQALSMDTLQQAQVV